MPMQSALLVLHGALKRRTETIDNSFNNSEYLIFKAKYQKENYILQKSYLLFYFPIFSLNFMQIGAVFFQ